MLRQSRTFGKERSLIMKPIQVTRASMPPFEEYINEIKELWETRWLTHSGVKHCTLEEQLENYFGVASVMLFGNGHLALELALKVLGLSGEVITTPFTFASTTQAILRNGLTPVFCDIEDKWYTMDPEKIEPLITEKTSAILPVHVYGNICDYKAIQRIADKYGLKVIYDAAHAFGETVDGINAAGLGDMSMFSFHATKVFNTIEGGCLAYKDSSYDNDLKAIRQFGMYGKEDAEMVGTNAKMTEFQAAMGICNLRHIDEYISARKLCADRYRLRLGNVEGITLCPVQQDIKSNYAYFPAVFEKPFDRDEVADRLAQNNIFARKYFYPLTSDFTVCRENLSINETPVAKRIADNVLTLPLYSDLTVDEVDMICDIILGK